MMADVIVLCPGPVLVHKYNSLSLFLFLSLRSPRALVLEYQVLVNNSQSGYIVTVQQDTMKFRLSIDIYRRRGQLKNKDPS